MSDMKKIKLFLVDDDALYLKVLEADFNNSDDFEIETYSTGELCIANLGNNPDIIVLDYYLDGIDKNAMNGIETLDRIKIEYPKLPVIMLSSQDSIDVAIDCMHHKATDYVVKSETAFVRLQKIVTNILQFNKIEKQLNWYMDRM